MRARPRTRGNAKREPKGGELHEKDCYSTNIMIL